MERRPEVRRQRSCLPVLPKPGTVNVGHAKKAKDLGFALHDPIQHKETQVPLGNITRIDERGVHTRKGNYNPDWVEHVPKEKP